MWRSYNANQVGVGLVINPIPLYSLNDKFGAFSSPVYYFDDGKLRDVLFTIAENIDSNRVYLSKRTENL